MLESPSWVVDGSSGIEGGSFSALSSAAGFPFPGGVFQGTVMILVVLPSVDSVADMTSS